MFCKVYLWDDRYKCLRAAAPSLSSWSWAKFNLFASHCMHGTFLSLPVVKFSKQATYFTKILPDLKNPVHAVAYSVNFIKTWIHNQIMMTCKASARLFLGAYSNLQVRLKIYWRQIANPRNGVRVCLGWYSNPHPYPYLPVPANCAGS